MSGLPKYPSGLETNSTPFCMPFVSASCNPLEARLGVNSGVVCVGVVAGVGVVVGVDVVAGVAAGVLLGAVVEVVGAGVVGVVVLAGADGADSFAGVVFAGVVVVVLDVVFAGAVFDDFVVVFLVWADVLPTQTKANNTTTAMMRDDFIRIEKKMNK